MSDGNRRSGDDAQAATEYAWLIEAGWTGTASIEYWCGCEVTGGGGILHQWSFDHSRALRFARKEDAKRIANILIDGEAYRIVEHGWDAAQPPAAPVTDRSIQEGDILSYETTDGVGKVTSHVRPPAAPVEITNSGATTASRGADATNATQPIGSPNFHCSAETVEQPIARAHVTLEDDGPYAKLEVLNGEALQPSMSPVDLYARPILQVPAYEIAMTLALSYGRDPDEPAPILEMCDENNQPVPIWMVYVEQAEALLAAYSIAKKAATRSAALQALADIDRDLIGHEETMANLDALKVRR